MANAGPVPSCSTNGSSTGWRASTSLNQRVGTSSGRCRPRPNGASAMRSLRWSMPAKDGSGWTTTCPVSGWNQFTAASSAKRRPWESGCRNPIARSKPDRRRRSSFSDQSDGTTCSSVEAMIRQPRKRPVRSMSHDSAGAREDAVTTVSADCGQRPRFATSCAPLQTGSPAVGGMMMSRRGWRVRSIARGSAGSLTRTRAREYSHAAGSAGGSPAARSAARPPEAARCRASSTSAGRPVNASAQRLCLTSASSFASLSIAFMCSWSAMAASTRTMTARMMCGNNSSAAVRR
ncbi:hypothetical protein C8E97_4225 [Saccharothrix australiensis]|uniref:Uncharacterized protein n=1 Tax=Saccharothrix australiensis TaxID=2072 RepID=A0A495W1K9_9PSEU|nr:hypothetical protein C8E97_4225 [Saccharothrix australiensis]